MSDNSNNENNQSASLSKTEAPPVLSQTELGKDRGGAMEVMVEHSLDKALKVLKRKMIKEGIFRELKSRRYYEKPSDRKKRKHKESLKKIRKDQARSRKNSALLM